MPIGLAAHQAKLAQLGAFAVAALLVIPALRYSLDIPVGLVERYTDLAYKFGDLEKFLYYLQTRFTFTEPEWLQWFIRFTPFFDVWNGLLWKVFGDDGQFHHLNRWLFHLGAVGFFIAAFRRFQALPPAADAQPQAGGDWFGVIPVAVLAYAYLFFPNPAVALIESFELYTVFFLGLSNWALALMLTGKGRPRHHALFCLAFIGLLLSKEINVAPALWLLVFYWALAIVKGLSVGKFLMAAGLTALPFIALHRISIALEMAESRGMYYVPNAPILDRFSENAAKILQGLFQYETSAVIAAAFVFLLLALAVAAIAKIRRHGFDGQLAFILLLLGEFASMFLVLSIQYDITHRYWTILIPCLATLLAFAAKFLLEPQSAIGRLPTNCTAVALAAFIGFFTAANYYNFLYQVIIKHSASNLDESAISEVASLLNDGKYVQANPTDWDMEQLWSLNTAYNHQRHWPNSPYGDDSIQRAPPSNPRQPYWILDFMGRPCPNGVHSVHANLTARTDYPILGWAAKLSGFLQGQAPFTSIDIHPGFAPLGEYRWVIYAMPNGTGDCVPCLQTVKYGPHGIYALPQKCSL